MTAERDNPIAKPASGAACFAEAAPDLANTEGSIAALRESEARLELATHAANIGIWDWDVASGRMTYSLLAKAICGFAPDQEVTYADASRVTHPADLPRTTEMARRALDPALRESLPYHYRVVRPDGAVRWVLAHGEAVFAEVDGETRAVRYVGTLQDVTEQRRLEESDRSAQSRLRLAVEAGKMAIWEVDLEAQELVGSPELNRLLGFPEDAEPTMEDVGAHYYTGERERLRAVAEAALARGETTMDAEFRYFGPDRSLRWLWLRAEFLMTDEQRPLRAIGVIMDVTQRKQSELRRQTLAELADRFRNLDDPSDLAYAAAETLGRALDVSRAGYGTVDPIRETITIERDWNAPGVHSLAGVLQFRDYGSYIEDLKRGATVVFADAERDPRTAATADALKAISAQAVVNMPVSERGGFVALLYLNHATAREWTPDELALISEVAERTRAAVARREAEIELRELNLSLERRVDDALAERKLWADVFESSDALIAAVAPDRTFLALNSAFAAEAERVFGIRPAIGDRLQDILKEVPDEAEAVLAIWDRALAGEEFFLTHDFADTAGDRPVYDLRFNNLRNREGEVIGAFQFGINVTERAQAQARLAEAEEALRQSQKMEAMGQLTGGVAHDFNNLLTPIVGSLDLLQRRGLGGERERRLIDGALQSAERAKTLVQRLLAFARRQPLQPRAVNLASLVQSMSDLVASTSGPRVTLNVDVPEALPAVQADPNQLEMAILNLAVNARDAMPDGGVLTISATEQNVGARLRSSLQAGRYIRLSVADTGVGMDAEVLVRAIEPFYSTKGIGRGTGLGLSMVHGLAAQLGGDLTIESRPGVGTNVELWLPVTREQPTDDAVAIEAHEPLTAGTALLVDDEELIRISTSDMLQELGYHVVEASSAEAAMKLLAEGLQFDVLVTDHLMPGLTGTELARAILNERPGTPVLIISGYAELDGIAPDLPRITKPFRRDELAANLAALVTRAA
ncbi:PAS domain S-box-containing protein [Sphingomonas sp. F9_3S_D5_B_2]